MLCIIALCFIELMLNLHLPLHWGRASILIEWHQSKSVSELISLIVGSFVSVCTEILPTRRIALSGTTALSYRTLLRRRDIPTVLMGL